MIKTFLLLIFAVTVCYVTGSADKPSADYCKLNCPNKVHTLCKYTKNETSAACNDVVRSGLKKYEQKAILTFHNNARRTVARGLEMRGHPGPQPAAKNMPNLEWDEELAFIAQRWADQCEYDHDCSNVERFLVSQNLAEIESSEEDTDVEELIQTWYDEVDSYNGQSVSSFVDGENEDGEEIGHYTQMLWAETTKIGCGFIVYKKDDNFVNYLVCNYGRSGNIEHEPVYQSK